MIVLPSTPRLASLRGFCLSLCFLGTVCIGMLARGDVNIALFGVPVLWCLGLCGVVWPQIVAGPYRAWNKLAWRYASAAERLVLWICYWTVMVAAGWTKTSLQLVRPEGEESLWMPCQSLHPSLYMQLFSCSSAQTARENWWSRYLAWASSSKQPWLVALLPFLCMLMWLKGEEESVVRESIYTLF